SRPRAGPQGLGSGAARKWPHRLLPMPTPPPASGRSGRLRRPPPHVRLSASRDPAFVVGPPFYAAMRGLKQGPCRPHIRIEGRIEAGVLPQHPAESAADKSITV